MNEGRKELRNESQGTNKRMFMGYTCNYDRAIRHTSIARKNESLKAKAKMTDIYEDENYCVFILK